jgi:hypothetical protein
LALQLTIKPAVLQGRLKRSLLPCQQLQEMGHEVIVANVRELRAISHSDRKSDQVDAEKLARFARLDPKILGRSPIGPSHSKKHSL